MPWSEHKALLGAPDVETPCDSWALNAEVADSLSREPTTASQCQPEGQSCVWELWLRHMATRALQTLETLAAPGGLIKASSFVVVFLENQNGRTGLLLAFYKGGVAWCVVHTVSPALGRPAQEEFQAVRDYIVS